MADTSVYSHENVVATLDGLRCIGWFDGDDVIEVAPGVDAGTMTIGADGSSLFSAAADKSATITLRVMHTSPTHRQLSQKLAQQRAGRVLPFSFDFVDTGSGEGGTAEKCFIQTPPTQTNGKVATVREWVLITGEYKPSVPNLAT